MRIILIILCVLPYLISAQKLDSLKINYAEENRSLAEIFSALEEGYNIRFSYACTDWLSHKVDANFEDESVDAVLDYLLTDQDIEYKIVSNNVLLRKSSTYVDQKNRDLEASWQIKGRVQSASDNSQLPFATIAVSGSSIGTYTNDDGSFELDISSDIPNPILTISYLGFEDQDYRLQETKDEFLVISMKDQPFAFEEVMIVNRNKPIRLLSYSDATVLSKGMLQNPSSGVMGSDLSKTIQLLSGVSAHDDSAEIKIRGSNGDQTMLVLDGMPIYHNDHYFGIFSSINTAFVDSVSIHKNVYPVQYGGKAAGLVDVHSNSQTDDEFSGQFGIDFLTADAYANIPISNNSSIQLAGRSTLRDVSNNQFNSKKQENLVVQNVQNFSEGLNSTSDPDFNFYDVNATYLWQKSAKEHLKINFFKSADFADNTFMIERSNANDEALRLRVSETQRWATSAASLLSSMTISKNTSIKTRAYVSDYSRKDENQIRIGRNQKQEIGQVISSLLDSVDLGASVRNNLTDIGIQSHIEHTAAVGTVTFGMLAKRQSVDYRFSENDDIVIDGKENIYSYGGYTSYFLPVGERISLDASLRATYYSNVSKVYFSPRILANYQLSDQLTLKSSFAIYQQVLRELYYEYRSEPMDLWVAAGQNDIPVLMSSNFMFGGTLKTGAFFLDFEGYQKLTTGNVEYAIVNPLQISNDPDRSEEYRLFVGEGLIRGIDFNIGYTLRSYETYLAYTHSRNLERYQAINKNRYYSSENDRRHQLKWVNTFIYDKWQFNLNTLYSSGRPYTDLTNIDAGGDVRSADPDRRLKRLPAYARLDVGTEYSFKLGGLKGSLHFSIYNLLNTQNVKYVQSVFTQIDYNGTPTNAVIGNESALLNRTFNVGFRVDF